jgi:hypothetical protein
MTPARTLAVLLGCWLLACPPLPAADVIDYYLNPSLARVVESKDTREVKELTPGLLLDNDRTLSGHTAAFLIVKTNEGRYAKLLARPARQKTRDGKTLPMLLIDRYLTYKEDEEQTVQAEGRNLSLYPGFRLSLDLGQVVPAELGGDLRFVVEGSKITTQPVGKARLYVVTKPPADVQPRKRPKLVVGETFRTSYFNGTYKLHDDGRRSGKLVLSVAEDGTVSGAYYSDRDGQKYPLHGRIGAPQHSIQFTVKYPRSEQTFQGWLFTGDGQALAGSSRAGERETGFYAERIEE